jgi:MoaA/NifB/PqqE/SkfB family radical SAM enzyme
MTCVAPCGILAKKKVIKSFKQIYFILNNIRGVDRFVKDCCCEDEFAVCTSATTDAET